jgi:hypothetical protein
MLRTLGISAAGLRLAATIGAFAFVAAIVFGLI